MIDNETVLHHTLELIQSTDSFVVDVKVKPGNKIFVYIDSDSGLSIDDCGKISRDLEQKLNRDEEDFELVVSTPGIDRPFVSLRQYRKYIGREVKVRLTDGTEKQGELTKVDENGIEIYKPMSKSRKKKLKQQNKPVQEEFRYTFDSIKETKGVVSFKRKEK